MTVGAGDALFGQDGTGGGPAGPEYGFADGIGVLPGLDLPVVRLPVITPDGRITGLDDMDADLEAATTGPPSGSAPAERGGPGWRQSVPWQEVPGPAEGARPQSVTPPPQPAYPERVPPVPVPEPVPQADCGPIPEPEPETPVSGTPRPGTGRAAGSRAADPGPAITPWPRRSASSRPARTGPAPAAGFEPRPPARPRIEDEPSILGLSRHSRSRLGSRVFTMFFVLVFAAIVVQLVVSLLHP